MFVEGQNPWLDEQTVRYICLLHKAFDDTPSQLQELFAIFQALPGPASTKLGYCIALLRGGFLAAVMFFLTWRWESSLPSPWSAVSLGFACHILFVEIWYRMGHVVLYISSWRWNILSQLTVSVKSPWSNRHVRFGHRNFSHIQHPSITRLRSTVDFSTMEAATRCLGGPSYHWNPPLDRYNRDSITLLLGRILERMKIIHPTSVQARGLVRRPSAMFILSRPRSGSR